MILRVVTICTVILLQNVICAEEITEKPRENVSSVTRAPKSGLGWISDGISSVVDTIAPANEVADAFEGRTICHKRKKHHKHSKFLLPMLLGFLLIKSILLPIALKGLAVLSGKAVVLSLMSLILAAIVGLKKVAQNQGSSGFSYDGYSKYRRKDHQLPDDMNNLENDDPYRYYRDRRRKK